MKIEGVEIYRVGMPLVYPFRTAYGDGHTIETVLVKMTSAGVVGWGEATPWDSPLYSPEWASGVYILVRDWLAPLLLGKNIESGDELQAKVAAFKGNPFAKASLDLAWWDLQAKHLGKPLWNVLGGISDWVEVGADFGAMETPEALIEKIDSAVMAGFKRVKLKIRPGWDLDVVRAVRGAFPHLRFHVDCNAGYRLQDVELFLALDEFGLAMIEQPLAHDDLLDHAKLQKEIRTPICLDESITTLHRAVQAIEIDACRWINLKPGRVGGITPALQVLETAARAGVPCWIGGMLESGIGASHCLALAILPNIKYPSDLFPSERFYHRDLALPGMELSGPSQMKALSGNGIGCTLDEDYLRQLTIEACHLGKASRPAMPAGVET